MNPPYEIVAARPQDVAKLAAIELAAAKLLEGHAPASVLDETTDEHELHLAQAEGRLWVALADDAPVGFALVQLAADDLAHLEELAVHPRHGQRGLGTALVRAVCEWAVPARYPELTLTTFRAVPWNMPFYQRLGFEEIPPAELRPELTEVVQDEAARGLDPERRVVMRYRTRAPMRATSCESDGATGDQGYARAAHRVANTDTEVTLPSGSLPQWCPQKPCT